MKHLRYETLRNFSPLFSFELVLVESIVVIAIFCLVVRLVVGGTQARAAGWTLSGSQSGSHITFNFNPAGNSNFALVVLNTDTNTVAYDSGAIANGVSSISWEGAPANYSAVLLAFGYTEISNRVYFTIPWLLNNPTVNLDSATFTFGTSNGSIGLVAKNQQTGKVYDSGAIPNGQNTYTFGNLDAGTYRAVVIFGLAEISNPVTFTASKKPVVLSATPSCNTDPEPNNVMVHFTWLPSQGNFSSNFIEITYSKDFSQPGTIQTIPISTSASSYDLKGFINGKSYLWRIRGTTSDGRTYLALAQSFGTTVACAPSVPALDIPTPTGVSALPTCVNQGQKFGGELAFNWTTSAGATSYTARLTFDHATNGDYAIKVVPQNFASGTASWNSGNNPNVAWVNNGNLFLDAGVTYYLAVSASGANSIGKYDLVGKSFKIGPVPICGTNSGGSVPTPTGVVGLPNCLNTGQRFGGDIAFNWTVSTGASSYTARLTYDHPTNGDYAIKTSLQNSVSGTGLWNNGNNSRVTWVSNGNLSMGANTTYYLAVSATTNGVSSGYDLLGKSLKIGPVPTCAIATADTDHDGFTDSVETYIGTDPNRACGPGAWPPDVNDDGVVNQTDLDLAAAHFNPSNYAKRYDMNASGTITSTDLGIIAKYQGKKCGTAAFNLNNNFGQVAGASTPSNLRWGTDHCSDRPTGDVVFSWQGQGDYWIDFSWDNFQTWNNKFVKNDTKTSGYGFTKGFYTIFPGRQYQWRLWNGSQHFLPTDPSMSNFYVAACSNGVGAVQAEIRDYVFGVGVNVFEDLPPGNGSHALVSTELAPFLYGLAGCESTWNPYAVNYTENPPDYGLYQYKPGSWVSAVGEAGLPANTDIYSAFSQVTAVISQIRNSDPNDPYNPTTGRLTAMNKWPNCSWIWHQDKYQVNY